MTHDFDYDNLTSNQVFHGKLSILYHDHDQQNLGSRTNFLQGNIQLGSLFLVTNKTFTFPPNKTKLGWKGLQPYQLHKLEDALRETGETGDTGLTGSTVLRHDLTEIMPKNG